MIDGTETGKIASALAHSAFILETRLLLVRYTKQEAQDYFLRGSHTGYSSLGVKHTRTVRAVTTNTLS